MFQLLLIIIYLAFISLGLPDSLLGSAWPSMYGELGVSVSYAGIISMIIAGGTIVSSLLSNRLIYKLGTGLVTLISVAMTAVALMGFSFSHSFIALCLWGIPYGLGAGSVDTALNNFVALHYKSRHMSWLHCFWGVGATAGPYIMGLCLTRGRTWNTGYQTIGYIQIALVICLIVSLPLWKKQPSPALSYSANSTPLSLPETLKLKGAKPMLTAFFCYCSLEATTGLWASSYLVLFKGTDSQTAAKWASLFYLGITGGRLISGFVTDKLGDKWMVRLGQGIVFVGILFLFLPTGPSIPLGLVMVGLGCGPIFPSLLHETPENFGPQNSQSIMGLQMACAYVGTTLMAPVFGVLAERINIRLYPFYLLILIIAMVIMVEKVNRGKTEPK